MGMRLVWVWLAGVSSGALMLAFVVYPPVRGWGEGKALTDWIGATGSLLAAAATFVAAFIALRVARLPVEQQAQFQLAKARVMAQGLVDELIAAEKVAKSTAARLGGLSTSTNIHALALVGIYAENVSTASLERNLPALDCFGPKHGEAIARGVYGVMELRAFGKEISTAGDPSIPSMLLGDEYVPYRAKAGIDICLSSLIKITGAIDAIRTYANSHP